MSLIHIYKRKGNRRCCHNHNDTSLLSIAGKILARVLLNRLIDHLEIGLLPESRCGFRVFVFSGHCWYDICGSSPTGKVPRATPRPYTTFVDLTKAFDTVSRAGLWKIMAKYGCPDKFIALVRQFHDGMLVRVKDDGDSSEPIAVTNGVKQGCVLAPTLFSIMFSAMLSEAFRDDDDGITIRYRTDGKLLNLPRLQAKSKVKEATVRDLLFGLNIFYSWWKGLGVA